MTEFRIKLAGKTAAVRSLYPQTKEFCVRYLTDEKPLFSVSLTPGDVREEQLRADLQNGREGKPLRQYGEAYLETLALYRKLAVALLDHDVMLMHGSALAYCGHGCIFTAASGTGKSTHARFWRERFGDRVQMINDDKPLLRVSSAGITVCGTPWDGKHHISTNAEVPLQAICFLTRAKENVARPISPMQAYPLLLQQIYRPDGVEEMKKTIRLLDRLLAEVLFYTAGCNLDPRSAEITRDVIFGNVLKER